MDDWAQGEPGWAPAEPGWAPEGEDFDRPPDPPFDIPPSPPSFANWTRRQEPDLRLLTWVSTLIEGPLAVLAPVGNLLTILALWRCPKLRTVANMYIASLAVADFLVGALIPWKIALTYAGNEVTRESKTMECLALNCCFFTLMIASMLTITAISVDRLLNVRLNLYYPVYITPKPARCVIVALWVVAFAVGAAPVLSSIHNVPVTYLRCHVYFMQHEYRLYQVYVQGGIFSFCSLVSFLCYGYIVLVAFRHKRAIAKIAPAPRLGSFHAKAAITKTGEFRQDAHQDPCKGECKGKGHSSAGGSSKAHGLTKNDRKDLTDEPGSVDSVTVLKVNSQARFVRAADAASCSSGISTRPFVGDVADTSTHSAVSSKEKVQNPAMEPVTPPVFGPSVPFSFDTNDFSCPERLHETDDQETASSTHIFSTSASATMPMPSASTMPTITISDIGRLSPKTTPEKKLFQSNLDGHRHSLKMKVEASSETNTSVSSVTITAPAPIACRTTGISRQGMPARKRAKAKTVNINNSPSTIPRRRRRSKVYTETTRATKIQVTLYFFVFGLFFVLWFPTFFVLLLGLYADGKMAGLQVLFPIGLLNSVCNVVVYAWKSADMRSSLKKILCGWRDNVVGLFNRK